MNALFGDHYANNDLIWSTMENENLQELLSNLFCISEIRDNDDGSTIPVISEIRDNDDGSAIPVTTSRVQGTLNYT